MTSYVMTHDVNISDDGIYRNIDNIKFDIDIIESNSQKYRIFRYIAIFKNYRDISEISRGQVAQESLASGHPLCEGRPIRSDGHF